MSANGPAACCVRSRHRTELTKRFCIMTRRLLRTALALPLAFSWRASGQTAVPPQPPVPPAISSRVITVSPPGSYLGIGIQEITAERAKALKLREEGGVEV